MMSFRIVAHSAPTSLKEGVGLAGNSSGLLLARETVARCSGLRALRVEGNRFKTLRTGSSAC